MIRILASIILNLLANAAGLIAAAVFLAGFQINGAAFVVAVLIFTVAEVIADPLITKLALTNVPALRGGVALVTTLAGLIITTLVSDGIQINGISTWIIATLIVWLFGLVASLLLPLMLFKNVLGNRKNR